MENKEIEGIIERISTDYQIQKGTVTKYYEMLKAYPIFYDEDAEMCLELLCQERSTAEHLFQVYVTECLKNGVHVDPRNSDVDTVQQSVEKVIKEVYSEYFEEMRRYNGSSLVEDLGQYDVMEREEVRDEALLKYWYDMEDIREKGKEKEKQKKRK